MKSKFYYSLFLVLLVIVNGCEPKEALLPTVITESAISNIKTYSAVSGGTVSDDGGSAVLQKGVCWSVNQHPTIDDSLSVDGSGIGDFTSNLRNLFPNTTYYLRAYATNSVGTAYGQISSFKTDYLSSAQTDLNITDITATTAVVSGSIVENISDSVISRGFCWSTRTNPSIEDSVLVSGKRAGDLSAKILNLTPNTVYFVRAFATDNSGTVYGDVVGFITKKLPVVETSFVLDITHNSALVGGDIISDGGEVVITKGVCWSNSHYPTVENNKMNVGIGIGKFSHDISGLTHNTTYYARAYATTVAGTTYGNEVEFKTLKVIVDVDGNIYHSVTIGTQTWMIENLKTTRYRNGELIGTTATLNQNIAYEVAPKYQWAYIGDNTKVEKYGRLYTWYAANDPRQIAPEGWHVPSDAEWTVLENYLIQNGYNYDGSTSGNKCAKALASENGWNYSGGIGVVGNTDYSAKRNVTGFSALPAGVRDADPTVFGSFGNYGIWWTSTEYSSTKAWDRGIDYSLYSVGRLNVNKSNGYSIRCIKD